VIIEQFRDYRSGYTLSELFVTQEGVMNSVDPSRFCYVLEDIGRPAGVKIQRETCIPEGFYFVDITISARWDKPMLILYNRPDRSVERSGVRFTGIRPHGGNDVGDTAGCPLCAYSSDNHGRIWNRASDDILDLVRSAKEARDSVVWVIKNRE
jgi:hypothetical protein